MKYKFSIISILLIFCVTFQGKAQIVQLSDSAQISLLTNSPWDGAVYSLFGHTAISVQDPANGIDQVFNYGLFDFESRNFFYRFAKGETDYSVGYTSLNRYTFGYQMRDINIFEQILNLTQQEKQNIYDALLVNILPENRIYRYNYFYDNCSTRPRDIIEQNIQGKIIYSPTHKIQSYRDLVHECVSSQPWVRFGIDLVIGADADKEITDRQKDFLPAYLMRAYSGAKIQNPDGSQRELVLSEVNLIEPNGQSNMFTSVDYPLIFGIILLIISSIIFFLSWKNMLMPLVKTFDFILFFYAGLCGCIIFFLMFFSEHPCTNPNWNIVWLNPVQLIFAVLMLIKSLSKAVYYYHFINFAVLIIFLLAWFLIPQYLEVAFIPYILALAVSSVSIVLRIKRNFINK